MKSGGEGQSLSLVNRRQVLKGVAAVVAAAALPALPTVEAIPMTATEVAERMGAAYESLNYKLVGYVPGTSNIMLFSPRHLLMTVDGKTYVKKAKTSEQELLAVQDFVEVKDIHMLDDGVWKRFPDVVRH